MNAVQSATGSEELFTVTNQLSAERPQVVRKEMNIAEKPLSAYALFFKETQMSIKSSDSEATYEQVAQIVETMWQALGAEQRKNYEEQSIADRERYEQELIAHRSSQQNNASISTAAPPALPSPLPPATGTAECIRLGCNKQSVRNIEWEHEYCSYQCVVLHCDYVFREWVRDEKSLMTN